MEESRSGTAYPEIIDEKSLRTKKRMVVETSITLGFWGLTLYLFITFLTFLLWLFGLKLVYSSILVAGYPEMVGLFANGMRITVVIVLILLLWSFYNRALIKIKGERRKSQVIISFDQDMADFFNIDIEVYREIINSPAIIVAMEGDTLIFIKVDFPTFEDSIPLV
jgi:poly-beta-1,6-N-acetyl-D-glucosamine biosynthesis protein PgaD